MIFFQIHPGITHNSHIEPSFSKVRRPRKNGLKRPSSDPVPETLAQDRLDEPLDATSHHHDFLATFDAIVREKKRQKKPRKGSTRGTSSVRVLTPETASSLHLDENGLRQESDLLEDPQLLVQPQSPQNPNRHWLVHVRRRPPRTTDIQDIDHEHNPPHGSVEAIQRKYSHGTYEEIQRRYPHLISSSRELTCVKIPQFQCCVSYLTVT